MIEVYASYIMRQGKPGVAGARSLLPFHAVTQIRCLTEVKDDPESLWEVLGPLGLLCGYIIVTEQKIKDWALLKGRQ